MWYFSHKGAWDDDEIQNEIQSTQQFSSIMEIAIVKTKVSYYFNIISCKEEQEQWDILRKK